ncbi:MAG: monovalent cation/H(+) antiporter subunit G [Methanoregula sp.]|nr:monovalent cation/H(+) antiporter subunit G [Methanoregula sp.]
MSNPIIDGIIFLLLFIGVGFGAISVIGLLLFPDIRSRMYTATRASLISISAMMVSVILYALFMLSSGGGSQYTTLVLHIMVLIIVAVVANVMVYTTISRWIKTKTNGRL